MANENVKESKWMTGNQVCFLLGISKRTLQNYRDQRRIPFYQVSRKLYFKTTEIDDFIEQHHIKAKDWQKGNVA